jgi:hypothetical protein
MSFQRKASVTEERVKAIDARIAGIKESIANKERDIRDRKEDAAHLLGELALVPDKKDAEENLKGVKKSIRLMTESLDDLNAQMDYLNKERVTLTIELHRAKVRDIPPEAEQEAQAFNELLVHAITAMEVLEGVFVGLKAHERKFYDLLRDRQNSLDQLGERPTPLDLKTGLGLLAYVGSPYGQSVSLPEQFSGHLIGVLMGYKNALENYKKFHETNPTFHADIAKGEKEDEEAKKTGFRIFGAVRT